MPIPVYTQQTRAPGQLNLARVGPRQQGTEVLGQALGSLAGSISDARAFANQKQEERAAVTANESLMSSRAKWVEEAFKRQKDAPESGEGYAAGVLADFDADSDERIKAAPTEQSRAYLKERLSATRLQLQEESLRFEANRSVNYKASSIGRAADAARTSAEFQPESFPTLLAEQRASIQASGLPADAQAKLLETSQNAIASAAVQGVIRRDPYKALRELNNEKTENLAIRSLDFDARQQLRNKAETEINRIEAERRSRNALLQQELSLQLQDARAAASYGIPVTVPEKSQLVAAFGAVRGEAYFKDAIGAQRLSGEVGKLNQLSNEQLQGLAKSYVPTEQAGAADQAQLSGALNQQIGRILEARTADPVQYLQQFSPTVVAASEAVAQNAAGSGQAYFNAVEAEKSRLGIYSASVFAKGTVPGSPEFQNVAILAVNKYKSLPPEAASFAVNALKSNDPTVVVQASQLLDTASKVAPAAYTNVPEALRAKAAMVARMVNSGAAPARAVQTAVDATNVTPEIRKQRNLQYREYSKTNASELSDLIDDTYDAGFSGLFSSQPTAALQLEGDFDAQASAYFQQTGDIDVARALAFEDLNRVYGESEVNGSKQVVAFPVERFAVTPKEVRKDIADLLAQSPQGDGSAADEVTLVADADTLRLVGQGMSGKAVEPSYRLVTKTGDLVRDKDGLALRYFVPDSRERLKRYAEEQKKIDEQGSLAVQGARFESQTRKTLEQFRRNEGLR